MLADFYPENTKVRFLLILVLTLCSLPGQATELRGSLVQGGMVLGKVTPGSTVMLNEAPVVVAEDGVFVLGFGRDAEPDATLSVTDSQGRQHQQQLVIEAREYNIQRVEGIDKKIMSPSEESLKRIGEEGALVRKARAGVVDRMDFAGKFYWPLAGPITGVYGSQRVYNGVPKRPHFGVDVAAVTGTPVTTPAPGIVTLAHPDMFYSGGTVIIDHGYGISSTLMHLSKVLVDVGQEVTPGDIVAEVGASGRATGPHLDWRMNWFKVRIDPQLLVQPMDQLSPGQASPGHDSKGK
jgi:hypothetical protein